MIRGNRRISSHFQASYGPEVGCFNIQIQRSPHTASLVQNSTSRLSSNGHIMFVKGTIRLEAKPDQEKWTNVSVTGGPLLFFIRSNNHVVRRNTCEDRYTTTTWAFSIGFFKHVNHLVRYIALDDNFILSLRIFADARPCGETLRK